MAEADSGADPAFLEISAPEFEVGADGAGMRLDQWLAGKLAPEFSRTRVQQLIKRGAVTVDGDRLAETKHKLGGGETIAIILPEAEASEPKGEAIPLSILFEDDQLIVVDKAAGLVVHPGPGNWTGTLVNALIHHCGDTLSGIGGVKRPGIVHRLDKDTSGVMVVAKTDIAHRALAAAFADHGREGDLERSYAALVWGAPERQAGTIDAPLGRAGDRVRRAVVRETNSDARQAITHFSVLRRFPARGEDALASLVECRLETGRTHQIRVHMAHIGHPLIGDRDYGAGFRTKSNRLSPDLKARVDGFSRQALHAQMLAFRHPVSDAIMRFEAPMPPDMAELIAAFEIETGR